MSPAVLVRGSVWMADLGSGEGREQSGIRPVLVVSEDAFNRGGAQLLIIVPLTSRPKRVRTHVPLSPPEGGVTVASFIKCEDVRSISIDRLIRPMGTVSATTMTVVEDRLRLLLRL